MLDDLSTNCLDNLDLEIDQSAAESIKTASRWAKFISIFVFVCCAFILLVFVFMSASFMEGFSGSLRTYSQFLDTVGVTAFVILLVVVLVVFLVLYYFLFNFSVKAGSGVASENIDDLNKGFRSLKLYFIIYASLGILGILTTLLSLFSQF